MTFKARGATILLRLCIENRIDIIYSYIGTNIGNMKLKKKKNRLQHEPINFGYNECAERFYKSKRI